MIYTIEEELFAMFPAYRRGVIVATGINNQNNCTETAAVLAEAVSCANLLQPEKGYSRVDVWNSAYKKLGADPDKCTPSIRFLHDQIRRGKPPRSISKAVDIMNAISIRRTVPCGGDDLDAFAGGDMRLGFARGGETFAPLFKPTGIETIEPGEVIYYTPQTQRVMCRRWTWRNADFSKLTPETTSFAMNIDVMVPPCGDDELECAINDAEELIGKFCGGRVRSFILSETNPSFRVA